MRFTVGFADPTDNFDGNVDNVTIGTSNANFTSTTYDFEPPQEVWVDDNWNVTQEGSNAGNQPGLDFGDTVDDSSDIGSPVVSGKTFGVDAFSNIADAPAAVGNTSSPVIIHVIAGTYSVPTTINKSVILQGDNSGTAGTATNNPETILNATNGSLNITASNVTVDGFTIRDASAAGGSGIKITAGSTDVIENNIITQNTNGVLVGSGVSGVTISNNLISSNNRSGTDRGQGVRVDGGSNVTLTGNEFTGQAAGPAGTLGAVTLNNASGVSIGTATAGNSFDNNSVAIRIQGRDHRHDDRQRQVQYRHTQHNRRARSNHRRRADQPDDRRRIRRRHHLHRLLRQRRAQRQQRRPTPSAASPPTAMRRLAQEYAIVDKINDGVDASGRGLVCINPQQVYVTPNSFLGRQQRIPVQFHEQFSSRLAATP